MLYIPLKRMALVVIDKESITNYQLLDYFCLGRGTNERTGTTKRVKSKPRGYEQTRKGACESRCVQKGRKGVDDIDDSGINEGPGSEEKEKGKREKRERKLAKRITERANDTK